MIKGFLRGESFQVMICFSTILFKRAPCEYHAICTGKLNFIGRVLHFAVESQGCFDRERVESQGLLVFSGEK